MTLILTPHAVDRFIGRCAPGLGSEEARALIQAALPAAAPLKEKTPQGHRQWRLTAGEYAGILVTRPAREPHHHVVVTVLPDATEEDFGQELLLCREMLEDAEDRLRAARLTLHRDDMSHIQAEIKAWTELQKTARSALLIKAKEARRAAHTARHERAVAARREAKRQQILASNQADDVELRAALRIAVRGLMTGRVEEAKKALRAGALRGILEPGFWNRQIAGDGKP